MNYLFAAVLSASGKSLFEELWDYFAEHYLDTNTVYPNLGFDNSSMITLPSILFGVFVGAIISVIAMAHDKKTLGKFVRDMLSSGAIGCENAKDLSFFGVSWRSNVGRSLRHGINLRHVVRCVEEDDFYEEIKKAREEYKKKREEDSSLPPFKESEYKFTGSEHFYIPEDKRITAETRFVSERSTAWKVIIGIIGAIIGFFVLLAILPYMFTLLDQAIGSFKTL